MEVDPGSLARNISDKESSGGCAIPTLVDEIVAELEPTQEPLATTLPKIQVENSSSQIVLFRLPTIHVQLAHKDLLLMLPAGSRITRQMGVGVGTLYRIVLESSKTPLKVFEPGPLNTAMRRQCIAKMRTALSIVSAQLPELKAGHCTCRRGSHNGRNQR